ncbi:MAG TPA: hypothetical protein VE136_03635, partial [Anaerolineales bacterium]|nr:hypothetical protein [Anaerolineales bacterium]
SSGYGEVGRLEDREVGREAYSPAPIEGRGDRGFDGTRMNADAADVFVLWLCSGLVTGKG